MVKHKEIKHLDANSNPLIESQDDKDKYCFLLDFVNKYPRTYSRMLKNHSELKDYLDWICLKTPKLNNQFYALSTKLYWIFNGLDNFPKCKQCNKTFDYMNVKITFGYIRFCSIKCAANNKDVILKKQSTCETKYGKGIKNPSQAQCVKDKKEQTSLKHYGVTNPNKDPSVRHKIECTCLKTYGVKSTFEAEQIKEKIAQTNLNNLGVANPFELTSVAYKGLQGRLKKYGSAAGRMTTYLYDQISFDSSWELAVWIYHNDHKIPIIRQPIQLQYEMNGSMHIYIVDFDINGKLVEVKGDHLFDEHGNPIFDHKHPWKEKYQCIIDNNIEIWKFKDIKPFIDYVAQTYGKNYLKQFRVNKRKTI